jgi:hypothetical protein
MGACMPSAPSSHFRQETLSKDGGSYPVWELVKRSAVLTKRKVIGTIENRPLAGGRCVRSRTHICLVAARQVSIRPHSKTASSTPSVAIFLFSRPLSLTPPLLSLALETSLRQRISPVSVPASISCSQSAAARSPLLLEPNPRRVNPSRPSIKFERQL